MIIFSGLVFTTLFERRIMNDLHIYSIYLICGYTRTAITNAILIHEFALLLPSLIIPLLVLLMLGTGKIILAVFLLLLFFTILIACFALIPIMPLIDHMNLAQNAEGE